MDKSKSSEIIRCYLRFAVSTIVYHRFSSKRNNAISDEDRQFETNQKGSTNREKSNYEDNKMNNIPVMTEEKLQSCFVNKSFCGLDELKFIDAVDENELIKDENGKIHIFISKSPPYFLQIIHTIIYF